MKFAIRVLVLGMLITGFAADHMLTSQPATTNANTVMVATNLAGPMPTCEPGTTCGLNRK